MKARHTSGPWHRNIAPAVRYPTIFSGRNRHVARVVVDHLTAEEIEANCDLIAEAPALLAEAGALIERLSTMAIHASHYEALKAAVVRAGGEL